MLLQHSRRDARVDGAGAIMLLAEQDRTRWHRDEIAEGLGLVAQVPAGEGRGEELRLPAVRAELLARAGDRDGARRAYETAIERCGHGPELTHLRRRRDAL